MTNPTDLTEMLTAQLSEASFYQNYALAAELNEVSQTPTNFYILELCFKELLFDFLITVPTVAPSYLAGDSLHVGLDMRYFVLKSTRP